MKKLMILFVTLFVSTTFMVSCIDDTAVSFDESLLAGKWQSGTVFYKYLADGTGITWDTADDVQESEGQAYTWTLVADELTHIHVLEVGGSVPKVYTVTELTDVKLVYEDDFGKVYTFTKVK